MITRVYFVSKILINQNIPTEHFA